MVKSTGAFGGTQGIVGRTHSDAQSFEDVHLAHGTRAMVQQPRIHAALMEQMSAEKRSVKNEQEVNVSCHTRASWGACCARGPGLPARQDAHHVVGPVALDAHGAVVEVGLRLLVALPDGADLQLADGLLRRVAQTAL